MGVELARLRRRLGWSRSELAARAGLTEAAVWRLETGARGGRWDTVWRVVRALAEGLGVPPERVLAEVMGEEAELPDPPRYLTPRYLTIREAARYLGVSQQHVRAAIRSGRIRPRPTPGPRGTIVIAMDELDRYAQECLEATHA
ncbi:MAG: helix-turn-helix domain-containing protein [Meiothermus sp.]|uniref:helix-turn-helix domain-containing protein n=1 Tax=Meiothermus sp. TaxID=1955249 RepID=UPI00298EEB71|nr:helix-turn-helix domain-containing protein [Meiothermus sp.]MDW8482276.1 helix-turn-helix domain-containing protein [Meiothermus sp.]